jgi:hypothetical protein
MGGPVTTYDECQQHFSQIIQEPTTILGSVVGPLESDTTLWTSGRSGAAKGIVLFLSLGIPTKPPDREPVFMWCDLLESLCPGRDRCPQPLKRGIGRPADLYWYGSSGMPISTSGATGWPLN